MNSVVRGGNSVFHNAWGVLSKGVLTYVIMSLLPCLTLEIFDQNNTLDLGFEYLPDLSSLT